MSRVLLPRQDSNLDFQVQGLAGWPIALRGNETRRAPMVRLVGRRVDQGGFELRTFTLEAAVSWRARPDGVTVLELGGGDGTRTRVAPFAGADLATRTLHQTAPQVRGPDLGWHSRGDGLEPPACGFGKPLFWPLN